MASYQQGWGRGKSSNRDYFNQKRRLIYGANHNTGSGNRRGGGRVHWFQTLRDRIFSGSIIKILLKLFVIFTLFGVVVMAGLFAYYSKDLPDPGKLIPRREVTESTKILDRNGELLYDIFGETKRTLISFNDMPQNIKQATVAIEDKDFYKHGGLDISRIITSAIFDVLSLSKAQGASTITQQFIRNALLTRDKSWGRKIKEIVLAIQIERKFNKDQILTLYLNEVPYGNNAYGIQAAAQTYFGKNASQIGLAEAAYLAALPQAPTFLSPYGPNVERLDARKNTVLQVMRDQSFITEEQKTTAQNEKVIFSPVRNAIKAPHFVLYVQNLLAEKYGEKTLQEGGLQVTTTLDYKLQKFAEDSIAEFAEKNEKNFNAKNDALVSVDPNTGQILAMVGSRNFFDEANDGQVNVTLRPRQPGSSFKPYVYATAFKKGYSPASMLTDVVTNFGNFGGRDYIPQNYNNHTFGPVSMRQALAGSLNIPAVKTILAVGVKDSLDTAHDLGITTLKDTSRYGPSLVLGGGEVLLLDHTSAFGVFATGGIRRSPTPILKITDSQGHVLEEYKDKTGQEVLDPQIAYLINSILSDNTARSFVFGARNYLTLPNRPVAAKTGTTQAFHDAWTIGYTPQLVTGVWVGNNNNSEMKNGADGSAVAAPIWNSFMKKALEGQPVMSFNRPGQIVDIAVDKLSGKLPTQYTPETKPEVFASFALPKQYDDVHVPIRLDKNTLKPATSDTPPENIVVKVFTIIHSERPQEENWELPVRAWAMANGYSYPEGYGGNPGTGSAFITISQPNEGQIINALPMSISVVADSPVGIKEITIYLDDKKIFNNDSSSVTFFYSQEESDGSHSLRVTAEDNQGNQSELKRVIIFDLNKGLSLTTPLDRTSGVFPILVEAQAKKGVAGVKFYYQKDNQTKEIPGPIINTSEPNREIYRLIWATADKPTSGAYEIYAQGDGGDKSNVAQITVP